MNCDSILFKFYKSWRKNWLCFSNLDIFVAIKQETGKEAESLADHAVLRAVEVVQGAGDHVVMVQCILYVLYSLQLPRISTAEKW